MNIYLHMWLTPIYIWTWSYTLLGWPIHHPWWYVGDKAWSRSTKTRHGMWLMAQRWCVGGNMHEMSPVTKWSTVGAQCHQMSTVGAQLEHSVTKSSTVGAQCHQKCPKTHHCHQKCHQRGQLPWGAKVQAPSPRKHNTIPNLTITIQFSLKSQQLKRSKQA